jgi:hypothetical protein
LNGATAASQRSGSLWSSLCLSQQFLAQYLEPLQLTVIPRLESALFSRMIERPERSVSWRLGDES